MYVNKCVVDNKCLKSTTACELQFTIDLSVTTLQTLYTNILC